MKKLNNKGFTLVELIATVVILSIVMGIGAFSITEVIKKNKENDYKLLITEIKDSLESYYQECRFVDQDDECRDNTGSITLGDLVTKGFLKGNKKDDDGYYSLVNPNSGEDISLCNIGWEYTGGKFIVTDNTGGNCPSTDDYS